MGRRPATDRPNRCRATRGHPVPPRPPHRIAEQLPRDRGPGPAPVLLRHAHRPGQGLAGPGVQLHDRPVRTHLGGSGREPRRSSEGGRHRRQPRLRPAVLPHRRPLQRSTDPSSPGRSHRPPCVLGGPLRHRPHAGNPDHVHLTRLEPVACGFNGHDHHDRRASRHVGHGLSRRWSLRLDPDRVRPRSSPQARRCGDHDHNCTPNDDEHHRRPPSDQHNVAAEDIHVDDIRDPAVLPASGPAGRSGLVEHSGPFLAGRRGHRGVSGHRRGHRRPQAPGLTGVRASARAPAFGTSRRSVPAATISTVSKRVSTRPMHSRSSQSSSLHRGRAPG